MDISNNWISVFTVIISIIALVVSSILVYRQAKISLKQLTLNYIEMENDDRDLTEAREWVLNINHSTEYIKSFYSIKSFQIFKGVGKDRLSKLGDNQFDNEELCCEYINGSKYINKIIATRMVAAEAIIAGMLDEEIYWLVRHKDFATDYCKLKDFMLSKYKFKDSNKLYSRKPFHIIVNKWKTSVIKDVASNIDKKKWKRYYENS